MRRDPESHLEVAQVWLGAEESAALEDVIRAGWVAQGPRVAAFETAFAARQQAAHAVAVSSGTAALHLSLVVAGLRAGDEVVVPSLSFIAASNVVVQLGARPVFADVDAATGVLTAETVAAALTPRTRAVIAVDHAGLPVDLLRIRELCDPLEVVVVEDAASAAGSSYRGRPAGAGADVTAWSFHPHKLLTTGEGGMITTSRADWAERARRLRAQGLAAPERCEEPGFSYRMADLQAAVGLVQLHRLEEVVRRRRSRAAIYARAIGEIAGLRPVADPPYGRCNFQSFWVEVLAEHHLDRDQLVLRLADAGVPGWRGTVPAHRQPAYADHHRGPLPATDRLAERTLVLPLSHEMTVSEQAAVVDVLARGG